MNGELGPVPSAAVVVMGHSLAAALLAWRFFGRVRLTRYAVWQPLLGDRRLQWTAVLVPLVAALAAPTIFAEQTAAAHAARNLVLTIGAVGIANVWAQGGLRASQAVLLGVGLAGYDLVATAWLPFMGDLFRHLMTMPLAPLLAWPVGADRPWLALGLGDVLVASLFPLVMRKAYGRRAGLTALVVGQGALAALITLVDRGVLQATVPVMLVLGPLMLAQWGGWAAHHGPERTMAAFRAADAPPGAAARPRRAAAAVR